MNESNTVFIVDDDDDVRDALKLLLESVGLKTKVYASAEAYLAGFDSNHAGCLILDIRMRGMSGLSLQKILIKKPLSPPIIIITGHGDVPMAVNAMKNGASDFHEKPFNEQELLESIYRALESDAKQRGIAFQHAEIIAKIKRLTPRERQVLNLIVQGKRNKIMAHELCVTQSTIEAHRSKVMEKMEARSLSDLMQMMFSIRHFE